jgi:RNA polymerase sigma-70 factor (ECF subfamily)
MIEPDRDPQAPFDPDVTEPQDESATLGQVLYADPPEHLVAESDWVALVQSISAGDQLALHALYERTHRLVFTLLLRIAGNRETAEDLTLEVFTDIWRFASSYDTESGTVLAWVMRRARGRAVERLRMQQQKHFKKALETLSTRERQAIESAFFGELTYHQVAQRLDRPHVEIKTEIHTGLQKLCRSLGKIT